MQLTFLNLGTPEIFLILIALLLIIWIGHYGKNTALGYSGSVVLAILGTPLVALIVIAVLKAKKTVS